MLKKNLFKKLTSAVLAMCFLAFLDFGCLAKYTDDAEEAPPEKKLSVITPNVAKKVLNEDQIQNEENHNKSAQTAGTDIYLDEEVPSLGSEDENE